MAERSLRAVAFVVLIVAIAALPARADDQLRMKHRAERAAHSWLKLVDDGDYGASWKAASGLFRNGVSQQDWERQAGAVRGPLGALRLRELSGVQYATSLPGAPDGKYVVLQYNSSFEHKSAAVETLAMMLDGERGWRAAGYYIR